MDQLMVLTSIVEPVDVMTSCCCPGGQKARKLSSTIFARRRFTVSKKSVIEIAIDAMIEILEKSQSEKNKMKAAELLVELKKIHEADKWNPL